MLVEACGAVAADGVTRLLVTVRAKAVGDKREVLFQVLLGPGHAAELDQPVAGVIGEPVGLHHGDDTVGSGREHGPRKTRIIRKNSGLIFFVPFVFFVVQVPESVVAAVSVDQAGLVEAVAAHHAADGVGKEAFGVFFAVRAIKGDLVIGNFGRKLVL